MEDIRNTCNLLMDEYQLLRERIEAIELGGTGTLTREQLREFGITEADLKRIKEIEQELDKNCSDQFPKYNRIDFGPGIDNGLFTSSDQ